jgi:hypothetical protein
MGWLKFCTAALEVTRQKFGEVAPALVKTPDTAQEQKIQLKTWSFIGSGFPAGWRESDIHSTTLARCNHLWWRWEALSPLFRVGPGYEEDVRLMFARRNIIPSSCTISQENRAYKTVSIQGSRREMMESELGR